MVVQRTLTPPVGVRSSHPQPQPQQANLLRFYYRGVAQMVARLVRDQEAVGSNPVTPTMRSVLIGSEYPTKDTPHFLLSKLGGAVFIEQQPIPDAQELYLVPGEQVNIALGPARVCKPFCEKYLTLPSGHLKFQIAGRSPSGTFFWKREKA